VQHQHDFLAIIPSVLLAMDDERRRQKYLLLQALMRVHPERARKCERKLVTRLAAGRNCRARDAGDAILLIWRRQSVPVNKRGLSDPVYEANAEWRRNIGHQTMSPVRLPQTQHGRTPTIHIENAAAGSDRRGTCCERRLDDAQGRQRTGPSKGRGSCEQASAR